MITTDGFLATSQAAGNTTTFILAGGMYEVAAVGTGSVQLQALGPDGATFVSVGSSVAVGATGNSYCAPGTYRIAVTTGPVAVSVQRIKLE